MKDKIHPKYEPVVFEDVTAGKKYLVRSTMTSEDKIEWEDGKSYPHIQLEVSSASHPFFTGEKIFIDTAGRVESFKKRYASVVGAKRKTRKVKPETRKKNKK
ncbi:MAG: type B 50S ribosomal protein L31 [Fibrobacteria bacterium]|nr:type B 50S ribosomal protein L31 [Fibrobacteria bacterium]